MTAQFQDDRVWQNQQLVQTFLDGVRGAIPLADQQIDCMLRLIQLSQTEVKTFLDLGCGDGILGRAIATTHPTAQGYGLDFSEPMLQAARNHPKTPTNLQFIQADFGNKNWLEQLSIQPKFDIIVSGFATHHQPDSRKQEIYQETY